MKTRGTALKSWMDVLSKQEHCFSTIVTLVFTPHKSVLWRSRYHVATDTGMLFPAKVTRKLHLIKDYERNRRDTNQIGSLS